MIVGDPIAVTGTLGRLNIERAPQGGAFELIEVELIMDAAGNAEVQFPRVSACPICYAVKRGTGGDQPAANFDLVITAKIGQLVQDSQSIQDAVTISGDVALTPIVGAMAQPKSCGLLSVKFQNSNAANSSKKAVVLLLLDAPSRNAAN